MRSRALVVLSVLFFGVVPAVGAQANSVISPGKAIIVQVEDGKQVNLTYTAPGAETVAITAHSTDGKIDTFLEVLDAQDKVLASNDDIINPITGLIASDSAIEKVALPAGKYTIRLSGFTAGERGPVEVKLEVVPASTATTFKKALLATEPLKVQLTGKDAIELVYYADSAETISVYARSLPANTEPVDTLLEIYDEAGKRLALNDDLKADSPDAGIENLKLPAAGTYTIKLESFNQEQIGGVEVELAVK
jgi:hypothetical protein